MQNRKKNRKSDIAQSILSDLSYKRVAATYFQAEYDAAELKHAFDIEYHGGFEFQWYVAGHYTQEDKFYVRVETLFFKLDGINQLQKAVDAIRERLCRHPYNVRKSTIPDLSEVQKKKRLPFAQTSSTEIENATLANSKGINCSNCAFTKSCPGFDKKNSDSESAYCKTQNAEKFARVAPEELRYFFGESREQYTWDNVANVAYDVRASERFHTYLKLRLCRMINLSKEETKPLNAYVFIVDDEGLSIYGVKTWISEAEPLFKAD